MIPWQVRAAAAFAHGVVGQCVRARGRRGGVLPLLTARDPAEDPPPDLIHAHGEPGARLAVVVHSHFPDVLPELLAALDAVPEPFDLLVTTTEHELEAEAAGAGSVRVFHVENRGRDILPLLRLVNAGLLDGYELVCKVHTKKSTWRAAGGRFAGDGREWRTTLVDGILGSPALVRSILTAFDSRPHLMMVTAPAQVLGPSYWGANLPLVLLLGRRGGIRVAPGSLRFAAGSMYWARGTVLARLRDLHLTSAHFDPESGQDDGTTAHAIERYLGHLVAAMGELVSSDSLVR